MPSSVVPIGEIASIAADASGIIQSVAAGTATGGDMATAINTIFSIAQGVMNNPFTAAAAASTAGIQLAAEHSRLQQAIASGNNDAIVDATLGLVGAIGGLIAMAPLPQTRAIGAAIAIGTIAARDLYRNRESIAGVLGDVFNAAEVARVPIVWIDPQTAIDQGLIDPKTLLPRAISRTLGTTPDPLVKTIRYVDPLILDLDGDGLEITRVSRSPPVLFDADADTVKTATAWAGPDDALLALDLNGNGLIDSGRELFGDETLLPSGAKAAHGFAALRALDSNADNLFSALDAQFTAVRLWRDLDQDGISDAGELLTLPDAGVQSINLVSTTTNVNYGDALLVQSGSFTRSNGSTGQAGSFILAQNNFVTEFTPIAVSAAAKALPNIGGSGWVRDLQEAATLNADLIALANTAKAAPTRAGYKTAVADLLREWGNESAFDSASEQALRAGFGLIMSDPLDDQERGWMDVAVKGSGVPRAQRESGLQSTHPLRRHARRGQSGRGRRSAYAQRVRAWGVSGERVAWRPGPAISGHSSWQCARTHLASVSWSGDE